MHKAVAARLANIKLSLYEEALVIAGFIYPCSDDGGTDTGTTDVTTEGGSTFTS
jgi:hypothetical protein